MRLHRVAAEIAQHPDRLNLYDDAGVACDRLHRDDEAIVWMRKKRAAIEAGHASSDDRYRYHANLGTFIVHRWFRAGADRKRISEVDAARSEIAQAIRLNPNAHFGREKYQLEVMNWILALAMPVQTVRDGFYRDPPGETLGEFIDGAFHKRHDADDEAIRGLCGLIVLGDAWESVDVFAALPDQMELSRGTVAGLAGLRVQELRKAGRTSFNEALDIRIRMGGWFPLQEPNYSVLQRKYRELRAEAERWQRQREAFVLARLQAGRHPDTDPTFWSGWKEPQPPSLAPAWWEEVVLQVAQPERIFIGVCLLFVAAAGWAIRRVRRLRSQRAAEA
jgi:hypothetical protein